ncbi:MAG TPA: glycosyltransferase family 39 protein [Caulobacteraceae bacterium]|nr:glycosyltransferase family 39 protein [Caulobacteraceae bacterium]
MNLPAGGRLAALAALAEHLVRGWRGPALAALVVLVSALPGLVMLPPLDRDESRFAQATSQMLETGDLVNIRFQDEPRDKKPVGIHWLQAVSVALVSSVERREIWAYRLPSLLGAMLAAAACAWGARPALGPRGGLAAGVVLGASFLLSSEAFIAKTDAVLCGAVTLSMAALGRTYLAERGGPVAPRSARLLFWLGQAVAILVKGPIGPMIAALALVALWAADRRAGWMKRLGWVWGLVLVLAVIGPWAVAITVSTDGGFWGRAVGGDLAPKLAGGHESHGAPPGLHLLLSPLLMFPAALLLPAALVGAWRRRREPFVRFALAWLVPSWLVFEAMPTKLVHYPLPLYGALAWLAAAALAEPAGPWVRRSGATLSVLAGAALAALCLWAARGYGGPQAQPWAVGAAALALAAGVAGALGALRRDLKTGLVAAGVLGVGAHMTLSGGLAPALTRLWVSDRAAAALDRAGLDPKAGVVPGPVAVAGYAEPSLVFALGAETDLDTVEGAAQALAGGQPALVERKQEPALIAELKAARTPATRLGEVGGYDYSVGRKVTLGIWRSEVPVNLDGSAPADPPAPPTPRGSPAAAARP